jgi:hypothetical protein
MAPAITIESDAVRQAAVGPGEPPHTTTRSDIRAGALPTATATATAIPYFRWDNRDGGPMRVWMPVATGQPQRGGQTDETHETTGGPIRERGAGDALRRVLIGLEQPGAHVVEQVRRERHRHGDVLGASGDRHGGEAAGRQVQRHA